MMQWNRNFHFVVPSFRFYNYKDRIKFFSTSECFRDFFLIFLCYCKMILIYYPTASILLILSLIFGFSEACSSRSTSKIRPPNVTRPNITYRTYPCPKGPPQKLCLNGGTCFTLFENSTDYFCKCAEGYCGVTCSDKYTRNGCFSSSPSSSSSLILMAGSGIPRPPETFPCPPGPAEWLCLNGGTCFTVFENATDFACHCTEGYCGLTCGEKYTRYGCFSRYLVISASVASAGTVAVLMVIAIMITYVYCNKKSTYTDADLKNYFEQTIKLRMYNRNLTLTMNPIKDLNGNPGRGGKGGNLSLENHMRVKKDFKEKTFFGNYLNLVRLI